MGIQQDQSFGPESYERELVNAPDMTDQETLVQLAKMNYNSYTEVASPGWYDLEGNWGVVSLFFFSPPKKDGRRGKGAEGFFQKSIWSIPKGLTSSFHHPLWPLACGQNDDDVPRNFPCGCEHKKANLPQLSQPQ